MSLLDEKAAALAEVLAATGEDIVWKGKTYRAFVSEHPLTHEFALGGFVVRADCTIKIPRGALTDAKPKLGDEIQFQGAAYRITRVVEHAQYPMVVLVAELKE